MRFVAPLLVIALSGCGKLVDGPHWSDQLQADSPCYEVDLLDGLDEGATTELRNLYDCVNLRGHLEPLGETVDALEGSNSRDGVAAGIEIARAVNRMPEIDVDPFALAGILLDALRDPEVDFHAFLDVGIELFYGRPASQMRAPDAPVDDLSSSVLAPLGQALPSALTVMLDEDLQAVVWFGDLTTNPETKRWMRTLSAHLQSTEPSISEPLGRALPNVGWALLAAETPENDRWDAASGNSLRDVAYEFMVRPDPLLQDMSPHLAALFSDPDLNTALADELVRLHGDGNLQAMPAQIAWMTNVDLHGDPLTDPNEPSALYRFLRLLSSANQPMDCQIDLWITQVDFSFGNLAVAVIEILADMDPQNAQNAAGIIAVLTDNVAADWMMHEAVDTGVCPALTHELVDDLVAVDVVTEPEATDLLVVIVGILDVAKNQGQYNHIPELADALKISHDAGGTEPLEELFRDVGEERLIADVVEAIPVLANPQGFGITAGSEAPVNLADALGLLEWAFAEDPDSGKTGLQWLHPLIRPLLSQQGTWDALDRAGALMRTEGSATAGLLDLIPPLLALDPELELLDHLGPVLGDTTVSRPLLQALESPGVLEELLRASPVEGQSEVPMAYLGRLMADGTFDDLLALIDLVVGDIGGTEAGGTVEGPPVD